MFFYAIIVFVRQKPNRYRQLKDAGFFKENKIDTVLVFGGTNDSWANAPLGELKYDGFEEGDLFSVLPAFCYFMKTLKEDLPTSKIVFIANCDIKTEIVEGIKTAGAHFGVDTVELCGDLGETLGFREISVLSPEKHDKMIAFLSQLTHCIAVSLMCACDEPELERYTGDSFRDLTRIANINDSMWSELFLSNRETLLAEMDNYRQAFDKLYDTIKNGNREEMRDMMRLSTARRKKFNKPS